MRTLKIRILYGTKVWATDANIYAEPEDLSAKDKAFIGKAIMDQFCKDYKAKQDGEPLPKELQAFLKSKSKKLPKNISLPIGKKITTHLWKPKKRG